MCLACVALWTWALLSTAGAGAAGIQVTQCTENPSTPGADCSTPTTVQPAPTRPSSQPQVQVETRPAAPAPPPAERHDYSLRSGRGRVQTPDGGNKADSADVSVSPTLNDPAKPHPKKEPTPNGPPAPPPVSTIGGAPPATTGTPFNFVSTDQALAQFEIPPFLVPIYIAAGRTYGIPWNVLASINRIETDFGRNLNVSSAGAMGWMQFMPGTWKTYGVDATGDGVADPYNPVDAVYAAARYLRASGGASDLHKAIFSYNHAEWYVQAVLKNAGVYGSLPGGLVAETGSLAYGRFPVLGPVRYADDFKDRRPAGWGPSGLLLHARGGARAVATQNVRVARIVLDRPLAEALQRGGSLRRLGSAPLSPPAAAAGSVLRPLQPALAAAGVLAAGAGAGAVSQAALGILRVGVAASSSSLPATSGRSQGGLPPGYGVSPQPGVGVEVADGVGNRYMYRGLDRIAGSVRPGEWLHGGDLVGNVPAAGGDPVLDFAIVASSGGAIDPRPLVDGYRLQEAANFYHAVAPFGANPFVPDEQLTGGAGGAPISGSDRALAQKVLSDPGLDIYQCGRQDIMQGKIDRRVLGALLYLRHSGMRLGISALKCGHSFYTSAGGISAHSFGAAVDIWSFNGQPVIGHQGAGTYIDRAIRLLMRLQGNAQPAQLISLESLGGPSFALSDHADHLHIGYSFTPSLGLGGTGRTLGRVSFPGGAAGGGLTGLLSAGKATRSQEQQLSRELGKIVSPHVLKKIGPGAIKVEREHAPARRGAAGGLTLQPAGAGAQLSAIAAPAGAGRGAAYAVGVVDGAGHRGWARRQTILVTFRDGAWRVLGAPRDAQGRVANPRLHAIAAAPGGSGYAVGDRGAVVAFDTSGAPRLLAAVTRARLLAVAARDGLEGTAVGAGGTVVRLRDARAAAHRAGDGGARLTSVALDRDGTALIAAAGSGPDLLRDDGHAARAVPTKFQLPAGSRVQLTRVAAADGDVWLGGSISDEAGAWGRLPFAARRVGGGWRTYCAAGPQAAAVWELGSRTPSVCDGALANGSGARGPVRALTLTDQGAVAATSAGLALGGKDFRPVDSPDSSADAGTGSTAVQQLALSSEGDGWALDGEGRVARVLNGRGRASTEPDGAVFRLPGTTPGRPAPVAVALGGDRALALSGGRLATLTRSGLRPARGPGVGVRAAAVAGSGGAWAIADSGQLLGLRDGRWSMPGDEHSRLRSLLAMTRALGDGGVAPANGQPLSAGFNALGFRSAGEGYAVGGGGQIARFDGDGWSAERAPTDRTLVGVAAARDGAVAVGQHGTLLERRDGRWSASPQAAALVGGADLSAVTALRDGTVLAAGGGTTLVRQPGADRWELAPVAAAGATIQRLGGYRDRRNQLHVVAMVDGAGGPALLDGDGAGWRPVDVPAGLQVTDVHVDERARALWLGGNDGKAPVVLETALPAGGGGPAVPANPDSGLAGLIASGSISLGGDHEVAGAPFRGRSS